MRTVVHVARERDFAVRLLGLQRRVERSCARAFDLRTDLTQCRRDSRRHAHRDRDLGQSRSRYGIDVVKRDLVDDRKHVEDLCGRSIRRKIRARAGHAAARALRPPSFVGGRERVVGVIRLEPPDAVLLHRLVLVNRAADRGTPPEAHLLHHADADLRAHPVFGDVDDGLQLQVIAEAALHRSFMAIAREHVEKECAHMLTTPVHPSLRQLHRAVGGEQVRQVVEQILVQVVAVRALEILQRMEVLHPPDPALRGCQDRIEVIDLRQPHLAAEGLQRRGGSLRPRPPDGRVVRRLPGHRIAVVEGRDMRLRVDLVRLSWRPVRGDHRAGGRHRLGILAPTLVVVRDEGGIKVERPELPDSTLLHERVLVHALHPPALLVIDAGHVQLAAPRPCRQAVRRDVDDRLQLDVVVHTAELESLGTLQAKEGAHMALAHIDAGKAGLDRAVVHEQIGRLVPQSPIDVVAVDALQVLDLLLILEQKRAMREFGEPLGGTRTVTVRHSVVDRRPDVCRRHARARILVVERRDAGCGKSVALHLALAVRRVRQLAAAGRPSAR